MLLSCLTRRCSRFPSQPNGCSRTAARSCDNWSARSKRCPGGIRLGSPPCTHTHTHTHFCSPQTCTKVEAKSGGSPCAAQVWEHARMQRVCPDQFVTLKLGILSGLPPQHHFLLKKGVGLGHWAWQTQKGQVLPLLESCRSSRNTREHLRYRQQPWKTAELTREAANRNSGGYLIKTSHTAR